MNDQNEFPQDYNWTKLVKKCHSFVPTLVFYEKSDKELIMEIENEVISDHAENN